LSDEEYPPFSDYSQTACKIRAEAVITFFNASTYSYKAASIIRSIRSTKVYSWERTRCLR
ncbi:unnamed protein product, partial [Allacma fusca]